MNVTLAAEFTALSADLMTEFGRAVTHTNSDGDEATIQAVLRSEYAPVGEYGERMEQRMVATVAKSTAVVVGDTLSYAGTVTDDDPYPDDVVWSLAQLLSDNGYILTFAVRQVTA